MKKKKTRLFLIHIRFPTTSEGHRLLVVGSFLQFCSPQLISFHSLVTYLLFSPQIVEAPPSRAIRDCLWTGIGTNRWDGLACWFRPAISLGMILDLCNKSYCYLRSSNHQLRLPGASHSKLAKSGTRQTDNATNGCTFFCCAIKWLFALDLHSV